MTERHAEPRLHWLFRDEVLILETPRHWLRWPVAGDAGLHELLSDAASGRSWDVLALPDGRHEAGAAWVHAVRKRNETGQALCLAVTPKDAPTRAIGIAAALVRADATVSLKALMAPKVRGQGRGREVISGIAQALAFPPGGRRLILEPCALPGAADGT